MIKKDLTFFCVLLLIICSLSGEEEAVGLLIQDGGIRLLLKGDG